MGQSPTTEDFFTVPDDLDRRLYRIERSLRDVWTKRTAGTAVLVGGTKVVANTTVTASSRIFLTGNIDGGTPGFLRVSARSVGVSFTITSSSGTDTSTVAWEIDEP